MRTQRRVVWLLAMMLPVVLLGACDPNAPPPDKIPNLVIWGPATVFTVTDSGTADPKFALDLAVLNVGLAPANSFKVTCDAIGTALFGANPQPGTEVPLSKDNVSIPTFDTAVVEFSWVWPGFAQTPMWEIDCTVDSAFNIIESSEIDNSFIFRFDAFCTGSSSCSETGGSLSAPPPPG